MSINNNTMNVRPMEELLIDLRLPVENLLKPKVDVSNTPIQRLLDRYAEIAKRKNEMLADTDEDTSQRTRMEMM